MDSPFESSWSTYLGKGHLSGQLVVNEWSFVKIQPFCVEKYVLSTRTREYHTHLSRTKCTTRGQDLQLDTKIRSVPFQVAEISVCWDRHPLYPTRDVVFSEFPYLDWPPYRRWRYVAVSSDIFRLFYKEQQPSCIIICLLFLRASHRAGLFFSSKLHRRKWPRLIIKSLKWKTSFRTHSLISSMKLAQQIQKDTAQFDFFTLK